MEPAYSWTVGHCIESNVLPSDTV